MGFRVSSFRDDGAAMRGLAGIILNPSHRRAEVQVLIWRHLL